MLFSFFYRQLIPLGVGECVQIRFPVTSCQKFGLETVKDFVAVPIELCGVIFAAADSEVAVWQTVSATKLFFEVFCSLGNVNSFASIYPRAVWVRVLIDARTGISTVEIKSNVPHTGHALYK